MNPNQGRSGARFAAVQALFQLYARQESVETVLQQFMEERFTPENLYALFEDKEVFVDRSHFLQLVQGVYKVRKTLDADIAQHLPLQWTLDRLEPSTRCLLQCGAFELTYLSDIPTHVILDEYVRVAHGFLLDRGYALVNALLQAVASIRRPEEPKMT